MGIYAIDGVVPVVHPDAFVHPEAVLIGDVHIGAGAYVGPLASLRGDFGRIELGAGANIQDSCVMHSFPGAGCTVEPEGHIGHGAVLHGCTVRSGAMVGMNAVVMDGADIGSRALVGGQRLHPRRAGRAAPTTSPPATPARSSRSSTPRRWRGRPTASASTRSSPGGRWPAWWRWCRCARRSPTARRCRPRRRPPRPRCRCTSSAAASADGAGRVRRREKEAATRSHPP